MKAPKNLWTHIGAATFGLLLAFALLHRQSLHTTPREGEGAAPAHPARPGSHADPGRDSTASKDAQSGNSKGKTKLRSSEYQKAWDSIADQSLPGHQRFFLQQELLSQWAAVDLDAALAAAFSTTWDGSRNGLGIQELLRAFDKEFAKRPTEAWDTITSGKFGLGGALAKSQWASAVIKEHPFLVLANLGQIPQNGVREILPQLLTALKTDPSRIGAFYDQLALLPPGQQYNEYVRQATSILGPRGTTEEIGAKFMASTTDNQRSILVHEYGKSLAGTGMGNIQAELAKLPEADRGRMLRSITLHGDPGKETPQLLSMLLQAGEYNRVSSEAGQYLRNYAKDPANQASLAQWAVDLPQTPEAPQVIHTAVRSYIARDPQAARAWLETVPQGRWARDQALIEYTRQVLSTHNDGEAATWAVNQITDPKIKQAAINQRAAWDRRNSQAKQ